MNISDILELTKAGWTKEEIMRLASADDAKIEHPEAQPEEKKETQPEEKTDSKPEEKPEEKKETLLEPKETETDKLLRALGLKLDAMTSAIQNSNVNNIEQGKVNVLTADDVIASIINPEGGTK